MSAQGIVLLRTQPIGRRYRGKHRAVKTSLTVWTVIKECQRYRIDDLFAAQKRLWDQRVSVHTVINGAVDV